MKCNEASSSGRLSLRLFIWNPAKSLRLVRIATNLECWWMIHALQPDRELREGFFITYFIIAFWFYFFFRIGCLTSLSPSFHLSITHTLPRSFVHLLPPPTFSRSILPPLSYSLSLSLLLFILIILIFSHKADTRLSISPSYLPVLK